ncbi:MAG: SUMF1/EgtB/PvdO family nonheme iron enzyme [Xanthomonadaceae bacterium]|nr:SUMF1/EgtB/PvdO family nonheme iron enzyme [Xanthomonadaceae bacterium]MDE2177140.1 SUMF1/EgtB/PvdO family nonheme iron enzyme [Xanthomonadaceae bacterium]
MPSSDTVSRQRAFGGMLGIALLLFALVYRFYPELLYLHPATPVPDTGSTASSATAGAPLGFDRRPDRSDSGQINAGPPLSLAPEQVIAAERLAQLGGARSATETPQVKALLDRAERARRAGRVTGTDSAAAYFLDVLKLAPHDATAQAGLDALADRLASDAGSALDAGDSDAAVANINALHQIPDTSAAVARLQQRLALLQKVRPLLVAAAERSKLGDSTTPAGSSALDLYRQVLGIDPQNSVARRGLERIQRGLLDRALSAVAQDDFATAGSVLAQAAAILPGTQQLQNVQGQIEGLRQQRAQTLLTRANSAIDAGDPALAQRLAQQAQSISADAPGLGDLARRLRDARLYASYKPGQLFADNFLDTSGSAPAMVVIPAGSFEMGARDGSSGFRSAEAPQHVVRFATGFALSRSEITVGQFRQFVRATGYVTDSERLGGANIYDDASGRMHDDAQAGWRDDYQGRPAAPDLPVINVSWNDAEAYVHWLSQVTGKIYRLPSEAEYEYAMRGGTSTAYWWGNASPARVVENLAGSRDHSPTGRSWANAFKGYGDGYWGPAPVMHFLPNPFGLYDIDGNVSEWTADCWHDNYVRAPRDGTAWINPGCAQHVVRGGSWASSPEQDRSAYRIDAPATTRSARVGFRVVRQL